MTAPLPLPEARRLRELRRQCTLRHIGWSIEDSTVTLERRLGEDVPYSIRVKAAEAERERKTAQLWKDYEEDEKRRLEALERAAEEAKARAEAEIKAKERAAIERASRRLEKAREKADAERRKQSAVVTVQAGYRGYVGRQIARSTPMPLRTPSVPPPPLAEDPTTAALMAAEAARMEAARQTNLRDSDQKGGRPQPPRLKSVDDRAAVVLQTMWRGSLGRKTHDMLGRTLLDKKHAAADCFSSTCVGLWSTARSVTRLLNELVTSTTTDADTNLPRALAHLISITAAIPCC